MAPIEQLEIIAEISAAFLGFIAIFIALSNEEGRFSPSDRQFVQALVLASALAIFLSLTPSTLFLYFPEDVAWHYSLMLAIFGGLLMSLLMGWVQWHMPQEESVKVNRLWHVPPWTIGFLIFILLTHANYTGNNIQGAYIAAVTLFVPISLWCFVAVVFRRFF